MLRRKGVLEDDAVTRDAALVDSEPALAQLAAAAVAGTLPAGPALRRRDPIALGGATELLHTKALCAVEGGFSLIDTAGVRKPVFDRWASAPVPTLLPDVPTSMVPDFDGAGISMTVRCVKGREVRMLWPLGDAHTCTVEPAAALPDLAPGRGFTSATCALDGPLTLQCDVD